MALGDLTIELVALGALAALGVYHLAYVARTRLRRERYRSQDVRDASNQLRFVMAADLTKKKIMGLSEYQTFRIVEAEIASQRRGHRVFAQTSLGQILQSTDGRAHSSINSKRVDILVIAPDGYPLVAVEYQGDGHYQGNAAARDAVKREALRKAGVQYLEISKRHSPEDVRNLVRAALSEATPPLQSRAMPAAAVEELAARKA